MSTILDQIADRTRLRVAELKEKTPLAALTRAAENARTPHDFGAAFANGSDNIIAEVKLASPSEGDIAPQLDPLKVAADYLANGAAALSILTEPHYFKGDLRYLEGVRAANPGAKLLMKDFVVDEYQLFQARAHGADAVLILLAMYEPKQAQSLYAQALNLGLTALVEVHDEAELELAAKLGAKLIGINNRNLKTMKVSLDASERLAALAPRSARLISESGIKTSADLKRLSALGYRGFLIGTHFMKTGHPGNALHKLLRGPE
ncbi:MAG: indole-3-glycerol phosphate synthase TrpC [Deltaproteobacteria bacterium]|nr:indole-3-glycerol phosphate synthase TrpC [Deltaproteobacteria bacterium]